MKKLFFLLLLPLGFTYVLHSQIITTIAGNCYGAPLTGGYSGDGGPAVNADLNDPFAVCVDKPGNIYIAEFGNNVIRKVNYNTGMITTVAGNGIWGHTGDGGQATNAELKHPLNICADAKGNLYVVPFDNVIRKIAPSGIITTIVGQERKGFVGGFSGDGGPATSAELYSPEGVCVDKLGNLYIADMYNNRIRKVDTDGIITTYAGTGDTGYSGDGGLATGAKLKYPFGVCADTNCNVYFSEGGNNVVRKIDHSTGIITTVAGNGYRTGYNNAGGFSGDGGPATNAELNYPVRIAIDNFGNLYIADNDNYRIRKVEASTGIISTIAGNGIRGFSGDGGSATAAEFYFPKGIAADAIGNVYFADASNRIRKISSVLATGIVGVAPVLHEDTIKNDSNKPIAVKDDTFKNDSDRTIAVKYGISAYPNPTTGLVNVSISSFEPCNFATLYLVDDLGIVLSTQKITASPVPLNLENYSQGIYFIRVNICDNQLFYKLIKVTSSRR